MCGIAGFATAAHAADELAIVKTMLPELARRGPDSEGIHHWPHAALGHRRLAIIDLSSAGHQPMLSDDDAVGLVFNGCIYNFQELRQRLEARGHVFRSNCDTEVILRGYLEWGIGRLLPELHGMFAFAIWDSRDQSLVLARDRLGVKPLLYASRSGSIAFASTLPALRAAGFGGEIDPLALLELLEFGFVSDTRCIVQGVEKLPPGHYLEWKGGQSVVREYWRLSLDQDERITFEDAVEETERLLVEAVRKRLVADVPIGVLLSGGVDSGLVCWALKQLNADIRSFTVGTPGDRDDETAAARETAKHLGIANEVVTLSEERSAPMEQLCHAYGEPFASTSALGVLRVSHAVKPHATVLLTGDGGDDVFLGYPLFSYTWRAQQLARRLPSPMASLFRAVEPVMRAIPALRRPANFLSYTFGGLAAMNRVRDGMPYYETRGMPGTRLREMTLPERSQPASFAAARTLMDDRFRFHLQYHFLSEFMPKVDGATMYHALEARSPMFDHLLWEFGAKVPYSVRLRGGQLKAVLREIAARRLGNAVARRPKLGFSIPAEQWLLTRWRKDLDVLRDGSMAAREGWFDQAALTRAVDEAMARQQAPLHLWRLVVFEHWLRYQAAK